MQSRITQPSSKSQHPHFRCSNSALVLAGASALYVAGSAVLFEILGSLLRSSPSTSTFAAPNCDTEFHNQIRRAVQSSNRDTARSAKQLTVVVPCRQRCEPRTTLLSLARQTFRDFDVVISQDSGRGANWARNRGFELVRTPLVLFSDDDVDWHPDALNQLKATLDNHPEVSYAYGTYTISGVGVRSNIAFDAARLQRVNFISTMSMIRTKDFPGFDEGIRRFQDWDVWLTMLRKGKFGMHCGRHIFQTQLRRGITHGNPLTPDQATRIIKRKHGLLT